MISMNNKLLLKPYKGAKGVRANVSGGFATVAQKSKLIGLELVSDFSNDNGSGGLSLKKGTTVYFLEEVLCTNEWSRRTYECGHIKEKFIIADLGYVVCIG